MTLSIFLHVCWPSVYLLWRNVCSGPLPIFKWDCLFFCYWIVWILCIFWMVTPDCDQTELGLNAQCCHQKATQRCFYWKKLYCKPTSKDAVGITSQSRVSLNKASNPSLLREVVHKHQARLCHCMDRWGHSGARAVSTLRAQTWWKISASDRDFSILMRV